MVSLKPGEHILLMDDSKYHGTRGKLSLTNMRVLFEYEKRGIVFKSRYSSIDIPLIKISEINVIGIGPFKKIAINTFREPGTFGIPRYEFNITDPEMWKEKIEVATMSYEDRITIKPEVVAHTIVKIKCPFCGMLVDENMSTCPNCNSVL